MKEERELFLSLVNSYWYDFKQHGILSDFFIKINDITKGTAISFSYDHKTDNWTFKNEEDKHR